MCQPSKCTHSHPPETSADYPVWKSRCVLSHEPVVHFRVCTEALRRALLLFICMTQIDLSFNLLTNCRQPGGEKKTLGEGSCPETKSSAGLDRVTPSICRKAARNTRLLNKVYLTLLQPLPYAWALASRSLVHLSFLPLGGRHHSHLGNRLEIIPPFLLNERLHFSLFPLPYSPHFRWCWRSFKLQNPFFHLRRSHPCHLNVLYRTTQYCQKIYLH